MVHHYEKCSFSITFASLKERKEKGLSACYESELNTTRSQLKEEEDKKQSKILQAPL